MPSNLKTQESGSFERRALSIKEAAKTCGLSRAKLYRLVADDKLMTLKIGARRLVPVDAVDALFECRREMTTTQSPARRANARSRANLKTERNYDRSALARPGRNGPSAGSFSFVQPAISSRFSLPDTALPLGRLTPPR